MMSSPPDGQKVFGKEYMDKCFRPCLPGFEVVRAPNAGRLLGGCLLSVTSTAWAWRLPPTCSDLRYVHEAASAGPRRSWRKASAGPAAGQGAGTASAPAASDQRLRRIPNAPSGASDERHGRPGNGGRLGDPHWAGHMLDDAPWSALVTASRPVSADMRGSDHRRAQPRWCSRSGTMRSCQEYLPVRWMHRQGEG